MKSVILNAAQWSEESLDSGIPIKNSINCNEIFPNVGMTLKSVILNAAQQREESPNNRILH